MLAIATFAPVGAASLRPVHPTMHALLIRLQKTSRLPSPRLHQVHAHMIKAGLDLLPFHVSKLLAAAATLADATYARSIFDRVTAPCLFHHTAVLRCLSAAPGAPAVADAFALFRSLHTSVDLALDQFAFIPTLKVCARGLALRGGQQLHCLALKIGFHLYTNVRNTVIHFYCCCGRAAGDARRLFDEMPLKNDAVSCSALMSGYLQISQPDEVTELFHLMHTHGSQLNAATIVNTFSAMVGLSRSGDEGEALHCFCIKSCFDFDLNVATAIADMYAKSKLMDSARKVFDGTNIKDLVLYNCIIDGYAKSASIEEALALLGRMEDEGIKPDSATFAGLLAACASSGVVATGRRIHEHIKKELVELDAVLGTALVDMYSKSGCLGEAVEVFDQMVERDVQAWTAMIMGLGINGEAEAALELFREMEEQRVAPNEVTFLAVLSACSHGGLVAAGKESFERMVQKYGLSPAKEHYGCLVDLFGRAGILEEAHELIERLPVKGYATAWRALLAACRVHGNFELGEVARKNLVALGDEHPSNAILLSSAYAIADRWVDAAELESTGGKEAGRSLIDIDY